VKSRQMLTALALGLLLAPAVHAQTVDEILAKHFEAQGGLEKWKALTTTRITGSIAVGQGMEAPILIERKRPGKERIEFTFQGMVGVQAFDGEQAWAVMPFMGKKDPEALSEEDTKLQKDNADFDGPLLDWKAKGHTVELAGKEQVEGAEAFKLKVSKKNGYVDYFYIDTETYLLVKQDGKRKRQGTEFEAETFLSDYKEVEGYMLPFTMEQAAKGAPQRQKFTFSKYELNPPIDDARFKMPAAAAATDTTKAAAKPAAAVDTTKSGDAKAATAKKTDPKAAKGKKKDQ